MQYNSKKSGGGVLIAILNEFSSEEVILNDFLHIELLCVLVKVHNQSLFIICVCIPPNSPLTVYEDHINAIATLLTKVNRTDQVLLIRDFNMSHT